MSVQLDWRTRCAWLLLPALALIIACVAAAAESSLALCRPPPRVEVAPRVPASHVIVAGLAVPTPTPRPVNTRGFWSLWQRFEAFLQRSMLRGTSVEVRQPLKRTAAQAAGGGLILAGSYLTRISIAFTNRDFEDLRIDIAGRSSKRSWHGPSQGPVKSPRNLKGTRWDPMPLAVPAALAYRSNSTHVQSGYSLKRWKLHSSYCKTFCVPLAFHAPKQPWMSLFAVGWVFLHRVQCKRCESKLKVGPLSLQTIFQYLSTHSRTGELEATPNIVSLTRLCLLVVALVAAQNSWQCRPAQAQRQESFLAQAGLVIERCQGFW
eukprot:s2479_g5.t1